MLFKSSLSYFFSITSHFSWNFLSPPLLVQIELSDGQIPFFIGKYLRPIVSPAIVISSANKFSEYFHSLRQIADKIDGGTYFLNTMSHMVAVVASHTCFLELGTGRVDKKGNVYVDPFSDFLRKEVEGRPDLA